MPGTKSTSRVGARYRLVGALVLGLWYISPQAAMAADWMFQPSYHTHAMPPEIAAPRPVSRSAYRRAWSAVQPGFAVRGGWRFNRIQIRSGNSVDTTIIRENWFDVRP